jgi:hypothetical protein
MKVIAVLSVVALVGSFRLFGCNDSDDGIRKNLLSDAGDASRLPPCVGASCAACKQPGVAQNACTSAPPCSRDPNAGWVCDGGYCDVCLAASCDENDPCRILSLVGTWEGPRIHFRGCPDGGACGKTVTFRCDGTFEQRWENTRRVGHYACSGGSVCVLDAEQQGEEPTYAPGFNGSLSPNCVTLRWGGDDYFVRER